MTSPCWHTHDDNDLPHDTNGHVLAHTHDGMPAHVHETNTNITFPKPKENQQ